MRRFVSLFIIFTILFLLFCGSSFAYVDFENDEKSIIKKNLINIDIGPLDNSIESAGQRNYLTYDELGILLQDLKNKYNKIFKLYNNRGRTYEDRIIWMVKISDNPEMNEDDETEVLFVGAHHGNEAIGNEMAVFIIQTLLEKYNRDPRITWLVDNHEIWIVPMPNPDGLEHTLNVESWRKNLSPNYPADILPWQVGLEAYSTSEGTDLNRNYGKEWGDPQGSSILFMGSPTYCGSEPFSEFETRAIRDLALAHNFSVYMDYHSGVEKILYPWGYTEKPSPNHLLFERIAEELSRLSGFEAIHGEELYQTNGNSIDWIYSETNTLAYTVELIDEHMPDPDTIQPVIEKQITLPLYLTGLSGDKDTGSQIKIRHRNIENQTDLGPYEITTMVSGIHDLSNLEVKLYYRVNNDDYKILKMKNSEAAPNEYMAEMPTQAPGKVIQYFIVVKDQNILLSSPDMPMIYEFRIIASPESIVTNDEIVAMVIMMIIIMGFFWGGFAYASRIAMFAEQRKLHDYIYSNGINDYFEERVSQPDSFFISKGGQLKLSNMIFDQRKFGIMFLFLGLIFLISIPLSLASGGLQSGGFILIVCIFGGILCLLHGIKIIRSEGAINIWRWDLGQ